MVLAPFPLWFHCSRDGNRPGIFRRAGGFLMSIGTLTRPWAGYVYPVQDERYHIHLDEILGSMDGFRGRLVILMIFFPQIITWLQRYFRFNRGLAMNRKEPLIS